MSNFIPNFHFRPSAEKLTQEWAMEAVNWCWRNTANRNLLDGKNVDEIIQYSTGDIDMTPFKRIYKSLRKSIMNQNKNTPEFVQSASGTSPLGIDFEPLPLLPEKLNSAEAIVNKIPVEVSCNATDPYALEKKQRDINFIKNKPAVEAEIQEVSDRLGLGEVDLGTTDNSAVPYSDSPFGLDLNNPDELDIFVNLLYSLKVESAFETGLQAFYEIKNAFQIRKLLVRDQLRYGVCVSRGLQSPLTYLPDINYIHSGSVEVPFSHLPDYSDVSHMVITETVTAMELFNRFANEIRDMDHLDEIVNGRETGYCACNNRDPVHRGTFDSFKVQLKYFEVKSVDYIGVAKSKSKKGFTTLTEKADGAEYLWGQNTYCFWWLVNTENCYGIERLGFAHREKGKESFQSFSINIYRSQGKSPVELSIGENKKAQIADIKLWHAIVKSLPAGRYFDLRYMRNALDTLIEDDGNIDGGSNRTMDDMINMLFEHNVMMGDTEGFEGKNDGQFKPVFDLPGGLKSEVGGYLNIIFAANENISRITGINQQLTGQSANPEGLVGMQKLLINGSINALNYCNEGITDQFQKIFSLWANILKQGVELGGAPKKAIVAIIGSRKANVIDGLDDVRLHDIGVKVKISQREEEKEYFRSQLVRLIQKGALSAADEFMVYHIDNPKDQYAFLAVKEQKWKKEQEALREQQFEQQQQLSQQIGQNQVQAKQVEAEGELKSVYAKGDVQSKILQLASQLGINAAQLDAVVKTNLQRERNKSQADKNIQVLREKSVLEQQESLL